MKTHPLWQLLYEARSGLLLAVAAAVALLLANSPLGPSYFQILHVYVLGLSVHHWINDGLMAVFFFAVGMEIKKELLAGELSTVRKASLPVAAALGGMVVPALIYLCFNPSGPAARGWGIPMATDIAFALAVLSLFGKRVPSSLKIFLLALAIADDLGAVAVIALFYTREIHGLYLFLALVLIACIPLAQRFPLRSRAWYIALGAGVWFWVLQSGVHATVAGVLLGFMVPLHSARNSAESWIERLHPWVAYGVMPVFALANAGSVIHGAAFGTSVFWGVSLGLLVGKPLGILAACLLARRCKAELPNGVNWISLAGTAWLGGIGFTVALFISGLALAPELEASSKLGIFVASGLSALFGALVLAWGLKKERAGSR